MESHIRHDPDETPPPPNTDPTITPASKATEYKEPHNEKALDLSETDRQPPTTTSTSQELENQEKSAASATTVPQAHNGVSNEGEKVQDSQEGRTDEAQAEDEDESKYLSGVPLVILTIGLCLTTFVIALDNTIIATAIPRITTAFNSLGDVGWYGSAYLLTTCSLQTTFGKIYTYFDVKYTYLSALVLFEVGSVLCAAARGSAMFIVGRAIAGTGASGLFSGGMTILGYAVPLRNRPIYIASLSSMFGIASVVGPILGGALTDRASWRWCFWINLPFGGVCFAVVFFFFSNPKRQYTHMSVKSRFKEMDIVGAVILIGAIVCLLLALQWGGQTYPWHDSKVWGNLLGFGLLILIFIYTQFKRQDRATLPPRILSQRTITYSCAFTLLLSMALYTHIYYLPFYFQASKGTTAEGSGIRTIAYLVSLTCASIVVGALVTTLGYYTPFMWIGSAIFTVGAGLLYTLKVSSAPGKWIGYQILAGIGAGAGAQIPFIAAQVVVSDKDMPTANACVFFFNSLGGAIAISIAQNIFINSLTKEIPKYVPTLDPKVVLGAGATNLRSIVPGNLLPGLLQAYNKGVTDAFALAIATGALAFVASFGMEMRSVKGKKLVAAAA